MTWPDKLQVEVIEKITMADDGGNMETEEDVREQLRKVRLELDDAKSAEAVAECVKESMVTLERRKDTLEGEMATMQQLLSEAHDEAAAARTSYEHQLAKAKAVISQLEVENQELRISMKMGGAGGVSAAGGAVGGGGDSVLDRDSILDGAAVISDATKSLARRIKSNLLQTGVMPGSSPSSANLARAPSPLGSNGSSTCLEEGMRKAHEDSELLKAIVVPLEEQIGALKDKLRETDALLREHEERQSKTLTSVEGLAKWLDGKPLDQAMGELLEKSKSEELGNAKSEERSENQESAYLALMSTRYSLLVNELASVRNEHAEVMDLLDKERLTVRRLKREAVMTNSEMLSAQKEHLVEVARLHALLTEEQKDQLLHRTSTSSADNNPKSDKSPEESVSSHSSSDSLTSKGRDSRAGGEEDEDVTRIVSAVEWESLQREMDRMRALLGVGAGDSVVGSDQYRALQAQLIELKKQKAQLGGTVERMREEAKAEDGFRKQLEERWNEKAEQHRAETEALNRQLQELESVLEQVMPDTFIIKIPKVIHNGSLSGAVELHCQLRGMQEGPEGPWRRQGEDSQRA